MKSTLQQLLDMNRVQGAPALLPAAHTTKCRTAETILNKGKLAVADRGGLEQKLVYCFYGLPMYRVSAEIENNVTTRINLPCCFLLDVRKLPIHRIYPFDTGAHQHNYYKESDIKDFPLEEYRMDGSTSAIQRYIQCFFGSNENYLAGKCILDAEQAEPMAITALVSHLTTNARVNFDARCKTIEIVCNEDIPLNDAVVAIVVPRSYRGTTIMQEFERNNPQVIVRDYRERYPVSPQTVNGKLDNVVDSLLDELENRGIACEVIA